MSDTKRHARRNLQHKLQTARNDLKPYPIWDLATRVSHWSILVLFVIQIVSAETSLMPTWIHLWGGYLLLLAVSFRLVWGLVGSESARLGKLVPSPRAIRAYLPNLFTRHPTRYPGHNPVGAFSSLLLLLLLLLSGVTGLFIETWAEVRGPLAERVDRPTAILMADWHGLLRWPLYVLAGLHVIAVVSYLIGKREDRIGPMLGHGRIALAADPALRQVSTWRALPVLLACATFLLVLILFGPIA
ncbi:MAG: cytochrome b/b6 domain-containing protein [Wenzhouxiangella sp.]